jgi:hypothetical protein
MANVLGREKREQVLALGRLGWSLRRIQAETGVRRETASGYLQAAGIAIRGPGRWGRPPPKPAKQTSTDSAWPPPPGRSPQASACEPYREWIESGVRQGRTAMSIWQDLVDDHGFSSSYASVKRFVVKLREEAPRDAHPGMPDGREHLREVAIREPAAVAEHQHRRFREPVAKAADNLQQPVSQQHRFTPSDHQILRRIIDQIDEFQILGNKIRIILVLRRLGAHQTVRVAPIRREEKVMGARRAEECPDAPTVRRRSFPDSRWPLPRDGVFVST